MGLDPLTHERLDPHGGARDLELRVLRATDPAHFSEDPLRGLRVAQFAARDHARKIFRHPFLYLAADTSDVMAASDLAVASCGMVAAELMALGVPAVLGVMSEDQRGNAVALEATRAARVVDPFDAVRIREALEDLLAARDARIALSRAATAGR